jgi:RNA polymerase sigma-70 factor, ECF subfamily
MLETEIQAGNGSKITDGELIHAIRRGDALAANDLVNKYYSKVLNVCKRYFKSHENAYDATQDVFMKVIVEKGILKYRGESQFWTWLYSVTSNTCKTLLLKQKRCHKLYSNEYQEICREKEERFNRLNNPEQQILKNRKNDIIHRTLGELPAKYQKVIYLFYWKGCSYKDAAEIIQVSQQVVGMHLLRGKKMLEQIGRKRFGMCAFN